MHWDIEGRVLLQQNDNLYCIDWQNHMTFIPPLLIPGSCYRFTYTFAVAFVYIYIYTLTHALNPDSDFISCSKLFENISYHI